MFRLIVDTCVWLDIAKDPKQAPLLAAVEELISIGAMRLAVPRIVLEEFRRNRQRIEKESAKSLSAHFRLVKDAVGKLGGKQRRTKAVLAHLDDVEHKIPIIGGHAGGALDRIEKLLTSSMLIEPTDEVTVRAAKRAIDKRAPFHRGKNSMADAIIVETYADLARDRSTRGLRFAFVTHNKNDFSVENGNQKLPHPDFADLFSRVRSLYFINLAEACRRIEPSVVSDAISEHSWAQQPRGLRELLEAEDLLFYQVWYNRHQNRRIQIERGSIRVVEKETYPRPLGRGRVTIQRDVWEMAKKAAARVEKRHGKENLGPWDDFEWGMINGKLSAVRWVLGDEWDFLDT